MASVATNNKKVLIVGEKNTSVVEQKIRAGDIYFWSALGLSTCEVLWFAANSADTKFARDVVLPQVSKIKPNIVYFHIGSTGLTIGKCPSDIAEQMKMLVTVLIDTFHVKHVLVAKIPWLPIKALGINLSNT